MGLEVQCFETAIMHILDLGERVLDNLRSDACGNACEEEKRRLERKMRFNHRPIVVVVVLIYAQRLRVEDAIACARPVVPGDKVVVPLALNGLKGAEKHGSTQGVFA